ncbi:hypothetical protein QZH41_002435 [Actinostola sp. cb2023]|nr:hypothetical protein QZH41_002435 [Actinostola sp. cb2023]
MSAAVIDYCRTLGADGRQLRLAGHVGFDSLPDQLVNKSVNRGFAFNILCIGETGIGKSTLMDCLFKTSFEGEPHSHHLPGVQIEHHSYNLKESNVRLKLTVVDTVGYGDQINKDNSLKSLDLMCMKKLDKKVNIIPVIAKSDTIARAELIHFKNKIMEELESNGVEIYKFPTDDETVAEMNNAMNLKNENHCDFVKLREMLIRTNMQALIDKTHSSHFELYRQNKLEEMGFSDGDENNQSHSLQETYELRRKDYMQEFQEREEKMRHRFVQKVKDKESELKMSEQELHAKFDHLKRVQSDEKKKIEEKRKMLEEEINLFAKQKAALNAAQASAQQATAHVAKEQLKSKKK